MGEKQVLNSACILGEGTMRAWIIEDHLIILSATSDNYYHWVLCFSLFGLQNNLTKLLLRKFLQKIVEKYYFKIQSHTQTLSLAKINTDNQTAKICSYGMKIYNGNKNHFKGNKPHNPKAKLINIFHNLFHSLSTDDRQIDRNLCVYVYTVVVIARRQRR